MGGVMGGERGGIKVGGAFGFPARPIIAMGGAFDVVLREIYVHNGCVVQRAYFIDPVCVDESCKKT